MQTMARMNLEIVCKAVPPAGNCTPTRMGRHIFGHSMLVSVAEVFDSFVSLTPAISRDRLSGSHVLRGRVSDPARRFERPKVNKARRLCWGIIYSQRDE